MFSLIEISDWISKRNFSILTENPFPTLFLSKTNWFPFRHLMPRGENRHSLTWTWSPVAHSLPGNPCQCLWWFQSPMPFLLLPLPKFPSGPRKHDPCPPGASASADTLSFPDHRCAPFHLHSPRNAVPSEVLRVTSQRIPVLTNVGLRQSGPRSHTIHFNFTLSQDYCIQNLWDVKYSFPHP